MTRRSGLSYNCLKNSLIFEVEIFRKGLLYVSIYNYSFCLFLPCFSVRQLKMNIAAEEQSFSTHEDTAQILVSCNHVSLRNVFLEDVFVVQRISLCPSNFPLYFQFKKQFWLPWRAIFCCFSCKSSDTGIQESNPTSL